MVNKNSVATNESGEAIDAITSCHTSKAIMFIGKAAKFARILFR
jgi:hypothetical protein